MISQIVPEGLCLKCQGCCRFAQADTVWSPNLLDEDIEGLLKNGIPPFFISENKKIRLLYNQKEGNFACAFLDLRNNKCKAYAFRPFECQLYPFLFNCRNKKVFLALDLKCPFIKEKLESQELKKYIQDLTGLLNNPSVKKLLKGNPQIMQAYPNALNLVELKV